MIIKIGILLLVFAAGYRCGDAAGMERGYKNCLREVIRNCRHSHGLWDQIEITPEQRNSEIQKGLDSIYGDKEKTGSGVSS